MSSIVGWLDQHRLKAPLEGRIFFDVLTVLVKGGRADHMQLAARQHRLEHIAGVHGALGRAGAHHGMQLVDEQHHVGALGDFLEHRFEPLLELAAILRARHQRAHVERHNMSVAQRLGHVAAHDALGQALDDGGLADAGLADQHRVILGAPAQDLDHAADLFVAADHRIELAAAGQLGQVAAVLLQRRVGALRIGRGDALGATHFAQRVQ